MNRNAPMVSHHDVSWFNFVTHGVIWMTLVGAGLLLAWFVAVLHDTVDRGEQRRSAHQQRTAIVSPLDAGIFTQSKTGEVR